MEELVRWCRRYGRSATAVTLLVAVAGLLVSAAVGSVLAREQRHAADEQLQRRARLVAEAVTAQSSRYVDALTTVAAAAGAFDELTATKFDQVTAPLTGMDLAGISSVAYLVPATDDQLGAVQARWRARGVPGLVLRPAGSGDEHIFSVLSRPLDGTTKPRTGLDATQAAAPGRALAEARRSGRVAISDPYQLIIDRDLPASRRQMSFSMTAPVYGPPGAQGRRVFRGWVLMGVRGHDLIAATLTRSAQNLVDVTLRAASSAGTHPLVAEQRAAVAGHRDLSWGSTVTVADRTWQLGVTAAATALPGGVTRLPLITTGLLGVLALLLAALVWILATGRARALRRVRAATAEAVSAEAEARRQADLLTAVLDNISDGVGVVDRDGAFVLHNPAAKAMLGVPEDATGPDMWQSHYGIYQPDGLTPFPAERMPLARALRGEPADHVEMVIRNDTNPDGLVISVSARPLSTADGTLGAVAVCHDITAHKKAHAELAAAGDAMRAVLAARTAAEIQLRATRDELHAQREYLAQILDAIEVTVVTCDTGGRIVHANRAARRSLPDEAAQTVAGAMAHATLAHPDGTPIPAGQAPLLRALHGEHLANMAVTRTLPDGTRRSLLVHARPLLDPAGATVGAIATTYDVTALREREADLRAFAGIAAHDLKAPLAAIGGYAELLGDELAGLDNPLVRTGVQRIGAGIDRMRRLIDDLLTYATARDGQIHQRRVDLNRLVADVITERTAHLRAGAGGTGPAGPDIYTSPLPDVHADPAMIRQVLDNFIGNAIKYCAPGQPARIDVTAHHDADGQVSVVVADRGIGIPAADRPYVFDTFHRAANRGDRPGTGLGLAICKRIIDRHGGTVEVTDNPGGGSRFRFTLPAAAGDRPADGPAERIPEEAVA